VQGIGNIRILSTTTQTPFITNCLVNIVHTKPVNSNFSPKIGCHGNIPQHLWTPIQHDSYGPSEPTTQMASLSVHRLCTDDRRLSLYFTMGRPFSLKNLPLPMGGSAPHLIHGSPGPPVFNPNGSSIGAAILAGLTSVTDRPTDHATQSVRIGRIYVRSTAIRPNNNNNNANSHGVSLAGGSWIPVFFGPFA